MKKGDESVSVFNNPIKFDILMIYIQEIKPERSTKLSNLLKNKKWKEFEEEYKVIEKEVDNYFKTKGTKKENKPKGEDKSTKKEEEKKEFFHDIDFDVLETYCSQINKKEGINQLLKLIDEKKYNEFEKKYEEIVKLVENFFEKK